MDLIPDLFGDRPLPVEHRSYFAIIPPPAQAERIERDARDLARRHNVHRVVRAARLHISLNGLRRGAELAPEQLEDALAVGEAIRRPAFDLVFDRIQTWDNQGMDRRKPVPTVLCCSAPPREAAALYDDLFRRMQGLGLGARPRRFNPHMTLWYAAGRLAPLILARPVRIRVDRLCLVHTVTGAGRPEHVASWPLKF